MLKILVAIEGSESCSKVAQKAQELALLCKGDVTFLTIVSPDFKLVTSKEKLENDIKTYNLTLYQGQSYYQKYPTRITNILIFIFFVITFIKIMFELRKKLSSRD